MYCRYCGTSLPDNAKFCTNCGAAQDGGTGETHFKKSKVPIVILIALAVLVVALVAVVLAILAGIGNAPAQQDDPARSLPTDAPAITTISTSAPAPTLPQDGWYTSDGNRYYYHDGTALTGLQDLDGTVYYFYEDGTLATDTTIDFEEGSLEFDSQGRLAGYTLATVSGAWSSESFRFGHSGKATILELDTQVEDCRSMTLYLEASGLRGAKVNGQWKLHIRSHGTWEYVQDISFTQPDGSYSIRFSTPKDFDAITVYPTVQGNASYNVYYGLFDLYCRP